MFLNIRVIIKNIFLNNIIAIQATAQMAADMEAVAWLIESPHVGLRVRI